MKTAYIIILFSFSSLFINAQDTLFLKNKEKVAVFVKEVSQTEVQYKKAELIDGPMYIINKNDIEKIVYKNGYSEVIKSAEPEKPFVVQYESKPNINNDKITMIDAKKRFFFLSNLVNRHPDPNRRPDLMKSARTIKNLKAAQDGTRTVAVIFGAFTIATGAIYGVVNLIASNNGSAAEVPDALGIVPLAMGSAAVVFAATAITVHVNLQKKRKAFVNQYNQ